MNDGCFTHNITWYGPSLSCPMCEFEKQHAAELERITHLLHRAHRYVSYLAEETDAEEDEIQLSDEIAEYLKESERT